LAVLAGFVAVLFDASPMAADESASSFREFLITTVGLSEEELDNLAAGRALVNVFDVEDKHELIMCGVTRVDVPWEYALEKFKYFVEYRQKEGAVQIRKIGPSPSVADFEMFSLPDGDVSDLKKAKSGSCNVKITDALLAQLQNEVDWSGNYANDVNRIFREMLVRRTTAYLEGGIDKLSPYVDKNPPQTVRGGMKSFLGQSSVLYEFVPEFSDYLSRFPSVELEGTTDFAYCVFEDFGMKPTLSTRHVSIYQPSEAYKVKFLVAEINLYSSHYFQAMYSLTSFLEAEVRNEGKSSYILWVQRFWFDNELKGMKRRSAEGRLSDAMKDNIEVQTKRLHEKYKSEK
jgi:hypothetical protein